MYWTDWLSRRFFIWNLFINYRYNACNFWMHEIDLLSFVWDTSFTWGISFVSHSVFPPRVQSALSVRFCLSQVADEFTLQNARKHKISEWNDIFDIISTELTPIIIITIHHWRSKIWFQRVDLNNNNLLTQAICSIHNSKPVGNILYH